MDDLYFIKNEKGQIVGAERGNAYAEVVWAGSELDIEYCNLCVMIAFSARGVEEHPSITGTVTMNYERNGGV